MEIQIPYVIPQSAQKPKYLTLVPNDPGSRYKTRQLQVQIVGKSKMIKTVLLNILDVAKDMQVPPNYIGTFMGYVIGAQAKFDSKKPERQQAFLSGEHDPKELSRIMLSFINEVLLCSVCGLPEILIAPEQKSVYGTCRACGGHTELRINDEKFKRFVMNHPPTQGAKGAFGGNKTGSKKDTSQKREDKDKEDKEDKEDKSAPTDKEKEIKDALEPKRSKKREDEIVWLSDTSEEAVRRRREEMLPDVVGIVATGKKVSVEELTQSIKNTLTLKEDIDGIKKISADSNDDKSFVTALFNVLVTSDSDLLTVIKSKSTLLSQCLKSEEAQVALLFEIENFCGKTSTAQLSKVPLILKELYDKEILDEDSIFAWNNKSKDPAAVASVRTQAAPMIVWLQEAEEESEGEEEEDDE